MKVKGAGGTAGAAVVDIDGRGDGKPGPVTLLQVSLGKMLSIKVCAREA